MATLLLLLTIAAFVCRTTAEECPLRTAKRNWTAEPVLVVVEGCPEWASQPKQQHHCALPCLFTKTARGHEKRADVFALYHPGGGNAGPPNKCKHQRSLVLSMESEANFGLLNNARRAGFDLVASTRMTSDVPIPYFEWDQAYDTPLQAKTAGALAAAFISNCGASNGRLEVLRELMRYIKVDSYGRCERNRQGADRGPNDPKMRLLPTYKFSLAFENSNVRDYFSEKLYQSYTAGSVPVVMGGDADRAKRVANAMQFAPSNHSLIHVDQFANVRALADYLLMLDRTPHEYDKYLAWKRTGWSRQFKALVDLNRVHSSCRICIRYYDEYRHQYRAQDAQQRLVERYAARGHVYLVRVRGFYKLRVLVLPPHYRFATLCHMLTHRLLSTVTRFTVTEFYQLTLLPARTVIGDQVTLDAVPLGSELEVVFV